MGGNTSALIPGYGDYQFYRGVIESPDKAKLGTGTEVDRQKPSTLAERGASIPWLMGHRRLGAVILWVGDRTTSQEQVGVNRTATGKGKKKYKSTPVTQTVYRESAWHGLCVGPVSKLFRIWKNGRLVYDTVLDLASNPSGSSFSTTDGDTFTIYWGQGGLVQPVNTFLGDASRVGISSRWPSLCYVVWTGFNLGSTPRWPLLEYEVEVDCSYWLQNVDEYYRNDYYHSTISNKGHVGQLSTAKLPTTDPETDPALNGGYNEYNAAHLIEGMLINRWPQGLSLHPNWFDWAELERLGQIIHGELLPSSVYASNGKTAKDVLSDLMADVGFIVRWQPEYIQMEDPADTTLYFPDRHRSMSSYHVQNRARLGALQFFAMRNDTTWYYGAPAAFRQGVVLMGGFETQIEANHLQREVTRAIYQFADRALDWKDMTIDIGDDGGAFYNQHAGAQKVPMPTATTMYAAAKIANRRSQESLDALAVVQIRMTKQARLLTPGTAFWVDGTYPLLMRVLEVRIHQDSAEVEIRATVDFYNLDYTDFEPAQNWSSPSQTTPVADVAAILIEVPAALSQGVMGAVIARVRADSDQAYATLHTSPDNTTYQSQTEDFGLRAGGELTEAMAADDPWYIAQGPQFDALGVDIGEVEDLSAVTYRWRAGEQLVVIGSEIFFLQKITAISGTTYRLDGLLRARYNTQRALHSIGDKLVICSIEDLPLLQPSYLAPGANLYVKNQPVANSALSLASITPLSKLPMYGLGVRPEPPCSLRVTSPRIMVPSYRTGEDLTFRWAYFGQEFPTSGAGLQNYGAGVPQSSVIGTFEVEFYTTGDVLKKTVTGLTSPTYTYTNATLVTDFGSEQSIKVKVYHVNGGYRSTAVELTVALDT